MAQTQLPTTVDAASLVGSPTPKLISIAQASRQYGINKQTFHKALPRIRHVRWDPEHGRQGVVLMYEDAVVEYVRGFRGRRKAPESA